MQQSVPRPVPPPPVRTTQKRWLRVIASVKFLQGILLMLTGMAALRLLNPGAAAQLQQWVEGLSFREDYRLLQDVLTQVTGLSRRTLVGLGVGAFLYAGLFWTEGIGLWMGKRWAEYLTVIATASLVPWELYEVLHRGSLPKLLLLLGNLAVVVYLVVVLRRGSRAHAAEVQAASTPPSQREPKPEREREPADRAS
jgi:uncharacterized membrane protein (DUF2068 family)